MTVELLRRIHERHELGMLAMAWLDRHYEELPICDCAELPQSWIDELTAEFEAALEDRAREWREKKTKELGL